MIEDHLAQLDQQMAQLLAHHRDAVHRLAEVPDVGVDCAQQMRKSCYCRCISVSKTARVLDRRAPGQ